MDGDDGGERPPSGQVWPEVLTAGEAALFLRLSAHALRKATMAGEVPAARYGQSWRYSLAALQEQLRATEPRPPLGYRTGVESDDEDPLAQGRSIRGTSEDSR